MFLVQEVGSRATQGNNLYGLLIDGCLRHACGRAEFWRWYFHGKSVLSDFPLGVPCPVCGNSDLPMLRINWVDPPTHPMVARPGIEKQAGLLMFGGSAVFLRSVLVGPVGGSAVLYTLTNQYAEVLLDQATEHGVV